MKSESELRQQHRREEAQQYVAGSSGSIDAIAAIFERLMKERDKYRDDAYAMRLWVRQFSGILHAIRLKRGYRAGLARRWLGLPSPTRGSWDPPAPLSRKEDLDNVEHELMGLLEIVVSHMKDMNKNKPPNVPVLDGLEKKASQLLGRKRQE